MDKLVVEICEKFIRDNDAVPTELGFEGFPASICASVNDMVVHGIPDDYKLNLDYRKAMDLLGNTVVVPIIKMICERVLEDE